MDLFCLFHSMFSNFPLRVFTADKHTALKAFHGLASEGMTIEYPTQGMTFHSQGCEDLTSLNILKKR